MLTLRMPGDKSISHRAVIFASLATGTSVLQKLLDSLDIRSTLRAMDALGVEIRTISSREIHITGTGRRGLIQPGGVLDCGNSGTTARLLLGMLAGQDLTATITGDDSLRKRPMRRVTEPLKLMGAEFEERGGDGLPIIVHGKELGDLEYSSPHASAQVKSALLLAGLVSGARVTVVEPLKSRDHSERMLAELGVNVETDNNSVTIDSAAEFDAFELELPGDISSAAFIVSYGLLLNGSEVAIEGVGLNPTRTGFLRVLERMGARVEQRVDGQVLGEPVGTLKVTPSALTGTVVEPGEVPALIDEIPVLAVLAACAQGTTRFEGVGELTVKESNRLELLQSNLASLGVEVDASEDSLTVTGRPGPLRGAVRTGGDHRMAMAFGVLSKLPGNAVYLNETSSPGVSYPQFWSDLARIEGSMA